MTQTMNTSGSIVSRAILAARLGYQFGTDRDLYQALGYPVSIDYEDYAIRYARQDIAKAVIDRPIKATWRGGFALLESDDDQETALEKAWGELKNRLSLTSKFVRLDKLTGLGRYGVLLLGLDDIQRSDDFKNPINSGQRSLLYVRPFGEGSCEIEEYESDPSNERFGMPKFYSITISNPNQKSTSILIVHYSRLLHITEGKTESNVFGTPRLECIYNRLMDLEKLTGGSAEMFWKGARPGYQGKVDPEFMLTDEKKEDLQNQIDEYEHHLRRILVNEGVNYEALAQQVADPDNHVDVQLQMISAATGIPKRILTGSERGELASTEDRENWLSYIGGRREEFAESNIIRPFVDKCMEYKILPEAKEEYSIQWASLFEESGKDKAEVGKIRATALKEYATNPTAEMIVPAEAFYRYFLGLEDDQIELIKEMQDQAIREEEQEIEEEEEI
jgi:uncharacterized protein